VTTLALPLATGAAAQASASLAPTISYQVTAIPVGNAPAELYVNPLTGRIYEANQFDNTLSVISMRANQGVCHRSSHRLRP
jgi:DNA-binding beta-propeller fold protein YncE